MGGPLDITVYYDYLCPWCYVAAVRLQKIKEEYGDRVAITWKGLPLSMGRVQQGSVTSSYINDVRARVCQEEGSISCGVWPVSGPLPSSSLPALVASKCARFQGEEAFERYHMALFRAYLEECRDISNREVLISLAWEVGLSVEPFRHNLDSGEHEKVVLEEYEEAKALPFSGLPTVIFEGGFPIEGALPIEIYRRAIERLID